MVGGFGNKTLSPQRGEQTLSGFGPERQCSVAQVSKRDRFGRKNLVPHQKIVQKCPSTGQKAFLAGTCLPLIRRYSTKKGLRSKKKGTLWSIVIE